MERFVRKHLNQVIKLYNTSNGTNLLSVPSNMMQPKMFNLNLIIRK